MQNCYNLQILEKLAEARAEFDAATAMSTATSIAMSKFLSKVAVGVVEAIGFVYCYVYGWKWQK